MSSFMVARRIVLVDPLGDVLFSGESVIAHERGLDADALPETLPETLPTPIAAAVAAIAADPDSSEAITEPERDIDLDDDDSDDSELCPETMRSAGSGVFRAADRRAVASRLRKVG
jgi:hypothetical protein